MLDYLKNTYYSCEIDFCCIMYKSIYCQFIGNNIVFRKKNHIVAFIIYYVFLYFSTCYNQLLFAEKGNKKCHASANLCTNHS